MVHSDRAKHTYLSPSLEDSLDMDWEDMVRCRCEFEDNAKGTIVYDNACNNVWFSQNRDARVFDKYGSHLIDQKNIRVRALEALISSECQL